jgi:hypothetical protein
VKVEYICHACLLIDTGDLKLVTDPWFAGTAYCGQWHLFPKPVNTQDLADVDVILISHGHEDHLHEASLRQLRKSARIFFPFSLFGGTIEYLKGLGFAQVTEAIAYRKYQITEKTFVTYIPNSHDNIIIIESNGRVLVNANDALHSYPQPVIDFYLDLVRERWPRIDYLFCGFGGASYFPNTVHCEGKVDRTVGEVREQLFAHNFCRVVAGLKPRIAAPFAADFALLSPAQKWINEVRFPRSLMRTYYHEHFGTNDQQSQIQDLYPGDILDDFELLAISNYRKELRNGRLDHLISDQYKEEIQRLEQPIFISKHDASLLLEEIKQNLEQRLNQSSSGNLANVIFYLQITDLLDDNCYGVHIKATDVRIERSATPDADCMLGIKTSSVLLRYAFASEWGGDALSIGYGCEIYLLTPEAAREGLDKYCLDLLSRYPKGKSYAWKDPMRLLRYLLQSPVRWGARRRLKASEAITYDSGVWLLKDESELREMYDLPVTHWS